MWTLKVKPKTPGSTGTPAKVTGKPKKIKTKRKLALWK